MNRLFSKPLFILASLALVFFYLTTWIGTPPGPIWNSPDETANAFWADRVADREPLLVRDFVVGIGGGVVHPRSFDVYGTALVPGSFPGLFLIYGGLKFFTGLPLSAMTPIFTAFAGLVLFALFRKLFDEKTAFWSTVLFYLHPAVVYYSGRGLFHNVLFMDLLVFAVGLFVLRPFGKGLGAARWIDDALAGVVLGFAVITRASEAPWVLLAALAFLPFLGKDRWKRAARVFIGGLLPLFVMLSFNATAYGTLLGSGYSAPPAPVVMEEVSEASAVDASAPLLPFGFHPRLIVMHGMDYGLSIFWWFSLAGILGLTVFLVRWGRHDDRRRTYLYVTAAVTVWLLVFYGSWFVRDHYDPARVTIGTSYVRYFLPIYVLTLPWVAKGLLWTSERLRLDKFRFMAAFAIVFALLSFRIAVVSGDESLLAVRGTLEGNLTKRARLIGEIGTESVIMTERFDKVFFPSFTRFIPHADQTAFDTVPTLLQYVPVYWYGVTPSGDQRLEMASRADRAGVTLVELNAPFEGDAFFQFQLNPDEEETQN